MVTINHHGMESYSTVSVTQPNVFSAFLALPHKTSTTDKNNGSSVSVYGSYGRETSSGNSVLEFSLVDASNNELTMDVVGIEARTNTDYHVTGVTKHRLARDSDGSYQDKLNDYDMGIFFATAHLGQMHTDDARRKPFIVFNTFIQSTSSDYSYQRTMAVVTSTTRPAKLKFHCENHNLAARSWYFLDEGDAFG